MAATVPTHTEAPRMAMFMRSGRWVNLYDPSILDIELTDWVTGASRVPRWGGQVKGDWSYNVLQHSDLVDDILTEIVSPGAPKIARLMAIAHDLHEGCGLGDIITPYSVLFAHSGLNEIKARIDLALFAVMGLPTTIPHDIHVAVKKADIIAAVSEAIQLLEWPEAMARRDVGKGYRGPIWTKEIVVLDERAAREQWWNKFALLNPEKAADAGYKGVEQIHKARKLGMGR